MKLKIPHFNIILYKYYKQAEEVFTIFLIVILGSIIRSLKKKRIKAAHQCELKIAHYTESEWYGGPVRRIRMLASFLHNKGYVQLLFCRNNGENKQRFYDVFRGSKATVVASDLPVQTGVFSFRKVIKLFLDFKKYNPHVLHIHKGNYYRDKTALLAGHLAGIPTIITYELCGDKPSISSMYRNWVKSVCDKYIIDKIMINSRDMEIDLCEVFKLNSDKIIYIPNFMDFSDMKHNHVTGDTFRENYDIAVEDILIGVAARLVPEKGLEYLIESMTYIVPLYPRVKLVLAGDGPYKSVLLNKCSQLDVSDYVKLLGYVDESKLTAFYNQLYIGVLPSLHEGMPGAVLEYMAMGLPVVATAVDGTKDLVEEGVTGLLVPPKNSKLLAEAIMKLLSNPDLAKQMGVAGKKRIEQNFTVQIVGEQIHNIYKELVV